jgi:DNA-binding NarL/FixJ family response regulator
MYAGRGRAIFAGATSGPMSDTSIRILVADDDALFCKLAARLLESHGYFVEQVHDGCAALEAISRAPYDLLIADVNMPGNEGLAVLCEQNRVPVLIVTGAPSIESAVAALRGAAVDYMPKPFLPEQFLARVADGVARGRALQSLANTVQLLRGQLDLVANLRTPMQIPFCSAPAVVEPGPQTPSGLDDPLSVREREVLQIFRTSPRADLVAERLFISPHTVKNHMKSIFRKLKVNSQVELLALVSQAERS